MKTKYNLLAGGMFLFGMAVTSCSSEELAPVNSGQVSQIPVKAVITVTDNDLTRTSLEEVEGNLKWEWELGDVVVATNAEGKYKGTLTVSELDENNKKSAKFEGNLSLSVADGASQKLNFHYLGKGFTEYAGVDQKFNLNLAEQSGEFDVLVNNDVLTSNDTYNVTVNQNYIAIPNIELGHITSVGHFAIDLPNDEEVASVVVSGENLFNSAELNLGGRTLDNKADAEGTKGITVAGKSDFYITLIPHDGMKFHFDVVSKTGNTYAADLCYEGTEEAVSFNLQGGMFLRKNIGHGGLVPEITDQFTYVLNFDANGGTNAPESMTLPGPGLAGKAEFTVPSGENVKAAERNMDFVCWMDTKEYIQGTTKTYYAEFEDHNTVEITEAEKTKTLYAYYRQKTVVLKVQYNFNGGQFNTTVDGVEKKFDSWLLSEYIDNKMSVETNVIELTVGDAKVDANGKYHDIVVVPTKDDRVFIGWKHKGNDEVITNGSKDFAKENVDETSFDEYTNDLVIKVEYEAQWAEIEDYTLYFDANVGDDVNVTGMPETMTGKSHTGSYMFDLSKAGAPKADKGLVFLGWGTNKNEAEYEAGSVSYKATQKVSTLYAIWKQETPSTSGDSGDLGGFDPTAKPQN